MNGVFTISLDFELHWGVFDKQDREARAICYQNTLQLIPDLLELFSKFDVHVTWATVGSLFAQNKEEWEKLKPGVEPEYLERKYSAYHWVSEHDLNHNNRWAHFAPESIAQILKYPGQELGTHTFSHYYCMEPQTESNAFSEDLKSAKKASEKYNTSPVSLVFPRNQFNPDFLKTCYLAGIKTVRSNPDNWFWTPIPDNGSNLLRKIFRTGDGYIKMGRRTSYPLSSIKIIKDEPLQLPASRLFRPWKPRYKFANKIRLQRAINEITTAAKSGECYHLWWHPENFGYYPNENLADLTLLLEQFSHCKKAYGMTSWNMGEYAKHLLVIK